MRTVEIAPTVTTAVTVTLADAATMTNIYRVYIKNSSALEQTIARATGGDTIDGVAASIKIQAKSGIVLTTNNAASGYLIAGSHQFPFTDSNPIVVGSSDATKKVRFEVDGLTTATTRVITVPDRDMTIGDLSPITNSLSGDVNLNNTGTYFDGPVVAQGTTGKWFVSGTVTVVDNAGGANFAAKLWDGTTVIASTALTLTVAAVVGTISLSGYISNPVGNLRISVIDATSTSGKILFNASGLSKDSTITAIRAD